MWIDTIPGGTPTLVPGAPFAHVQYPIGWIDATHLAVSMYGIQQSDYSLGSLDITTGTLRVIATVTIPEATGLFLLSPDGGTDIFYTFPFQDYTFTPTFEEIDTSSGVITPLPAIARELAGIGYSGFAWKPQTRTLAVSTGFLDNGNLEVWLLDLTSDSLTRVLSGQYVDAWSPDGNTLITSTNNEYAIGQGPFSISATTFGAGGQPTTTLLTSQAMTFPFVGFVRNP